MIITFVFLIILSIKDITENKIPNQILLVWLCTNSLIIFFSNLSLTYAIYGGISLFTLGLLLFFLKAMSPGDVKLLGAVGYAIGWDLVLPFMFWGLIASGIVALFYVARNISLLGVSNPFYLISNRRLFFMSNNVGSDSNTARYNEKLTMPFAPCVVIGLSLTLYFN